MHRTTAVNWIFGFQETMKCKDRLLLPFHEKSEASAGSLDGMHFWCEKPMESICKAAKCGPMTFMRGRKKKFGVNLQGVCDVEGHFLDISIGHQGFTLDHLAFSTSGLFCKLEQNGFWQMDFVCLAIWRV
jgi:hypothetical protein